MAVRVVLTLLAVAAIGWLAVSLRDQQLVVDAEPLILAPPGERPTARQAARVAQQLLDARLLNPDTHPELDRAALALRVSRPRMAASILEPLVREEPANLEAWALLAVAARSFDARRAAQARAEVDRLRPLDPANR